MSRRTREKTAKSPVVGRGRRLYRGSCLIDPGITPDRQDFTVVTEFHLKAEYDEIRWDLESPISIAFVEFSKSSCYQNVGAIIRSVRGPLESAIRIILSIELFIERPDSRALIADMIGLLVRFATPVPGDPIYTRPNLTTRNYRLEVSLGCRVSDVLECVSDSDDLPQARRPIIEKIDSDREEMVVSDPRVVYRGEEVTPPTELQAAVHEGSPEKSRTAQEDPAKLLKSLFSGLPDEPKSLLDAVISLQRAFRQEAARILQPAVNKLLKSPPESFAEKQQLASELNDAFHELGLGAREPDLATPCSIVPIKSQTFASGWLKLQTRKLPRQRSRPSTELGPIELIEAVRKESFGRSK